MPPGITRSHKAGFNDTFCRKSDAKKISFITRKMVEHFGKVPAGDYRDWDAIAAWGKEIAGKVGS